MTETTDNLEQMCETDQKMDQKQMDDMSDFLSRQPYKVVVIYSGWSLSTIEDKLWNFGSNTDFGMCRVDRYKGEETNRTICLMKKSFYDKLVNMGYNKRKYGEDFCCSEYKLREHNFPKLGIK